PRSPPPAKPVTRRLRAKAEIRAHTHEHVDVRSWWLSATPVHLSFIVLTHLGRELIDHFVGRHQDRVWHGQTKCLGSLEIDDQFLLGGRLHRQVGYFSAFENAINVARGLPIRFNRIRSVGNKATLYGENAKRINRRKPVPSCLRDNGCSMNERRSARRDNQAA